MFMFTWKKLRNKRPTPGAQRQALRDAARDAARESLKKKPERSGRLLLIRRNSSPAFAREQARRDRAMMSSSLRRRMTWQQSLCLAPVIDLPRIKK